MNKLLSLAIAAMGSLLLASCSLFGSHDVESAPYKALEQHGNIEIRLYDPMVLVTTPMPGGMEAGNREAFYRLFDYITGKNAGDQKIAMTAPVIMEGEKSGTKISMTAPVFMDETEGRETMSFVLPASFKLATAPKPLDPQVRLREVRNMTVAAIRFSGFLDEKNIEKHGAELEAWIKENGYRQKGASQVAGYDPPWTLPFMRRNEVLIPVSKKR